MSVQAAPKDAGIKSAILQADAPRTPGVDKQIPATVVACTRKKAHLHRLGASTEQRLHVVDSETNIVNSAIQTWLLRSEGKTILVQTGVGNHKDRPYAPSGTASKRTSWPTSPGPVSSRRTWTS